MFTRRQLLTCAAFTAMAPSAWAQQYPSRLLRVVVPYPAGSALDVVARTGTELFTERFGQPAIVVNQPGASGAIGTRAVANAVPDGYTILLGTNQTHGANSALYPQLGYDAIKDFAPLAMVGRLQHALVVRKGLGVSTLAELIALSKQPGKALNYGSSGMGSASHLAAEMFKIASGIVMEHIPYNGSGPVAQALRGGHIDIAFSTLPSVLTFIRAGDLGVIALASGIRAPQMPELPTLNELGLKNTEADAWAGFFAPAKAPTAATDALSRFMVEAFSKAEVIQKLDANGFVPNVQAHADFARFLVQDMKRWENVIRAANVKV